MTRTYSSVASAIEDANDLLGVRGAKESYTFQKKCLQVISSSVRDSTLEQNNRITHVDRVRPHTVMSVVNVTLK